MSAATEAKSSRGPEGAAPRELRKTETQRFPPRKVH